MLVSAETDSPGRQVALSSQQVNDVPEVVGPIDSPLQQQEGKADDVPGEPGVVLHYQAVSSRSCNRDSRTVSQSIQLFSNHQFYTMLYSTDYKLPMQQTTSCLLSALHNRLQTVHYLPYTTDYKLSTICPTQQTTNCTLSATSSLTHLLLNSLTFSLCTHF